MIGAMALRAAPHADTRPLPPARNRAGAWRLTMPGALTWRLFQIFISSLVFFVVVATRSSLTGAPLCIALFCVYGLAAWRLDLAITADDDRIAATRASGPPLWSQPIRDLTAVKDRGLEVLVTFITGKTGALSCGLADRMRLADHLRRRLAKRTAA
jgi:hypothetical protein